MIQKSDSEVPTDCRALEGRSEVQCNSLSDGVKVQKIERKTYSIGFCYFTKLHSNIEMLNVISLSCQIEIQDWLPTNPRKAGFTPAQLMDVCTA